MIYPVDSAIQRLNNRGLVNEFTVLLVVCQLSSDVMFRSIYCHSLTVVEILHYSFGTRPCPQAEGIASELGINLTVQ